MLSASLSDPLLTCAVFPRPYNNPFLSFPAVTSSPSSHPSCPPSSHFLAMAGNELPQWIAINGVGVGVGVGSLVVDKDTPVSTTQEPVFPLNLLLKWGTNLGHIKKFCYKVKEARHRAPFWFVFGSRVF